MVTIEGLALLQLSEFYTVTAMTEGAAGDSVQVRRVLKIPTENIPRDVRESAVVNDVIKDTGDFYQYISFLLSDSYTRAALENSDIRNSGFFADSKGAVMPALYERMLKAAAKSKGKFRELEYIMKMVEDKGVVPEGFHELYETFRKAVGLRG
jgi:hypothetical protein